MSITSPSTPLTPADSTTTSRRTPKRVLRAAIAVGVLASVTAGGVSLAAAASDGNNRRARTMEVDIAENGRRFVFDEAPVFDDGMPAYGNPFVTQGYIYPAGTLSDKQRGQTRRQPRVPGQGHRRMEL